MAFFALFPSFFVGQKEEIMKIKYVSDKELVKDLDAADYWLAQLKLLKRELKRAKQRDQYNHLKYGESVLGTGSEGNYTLFKLIAIKTTNPEDFTLYNECLEILHMALTQISPESLAIIDEIYYKKKTRRKIAEELKISAVAVGKREKKALKQLNDILEKRLKSDEDFRRLFNF